MLEAQGILESELLAKKSGKTSNVEVDADSPIKFGMLTKSSDLLGTGGDIFELGLSQALGTAKKVLSVGDLHLELNFLSLFYGQKLMSIRNVC
jgi:hypothetical protein